MKLIHWLMGLALFTSSCDIILVLQMGGTIRLANILMLILMVAAIGHAVQTGTILWPRGGSMLAAWCVIQGLLIARSSIPSFSVQIYVLLLFTVAGVYAVLQLYGRSGRVESLMKVYLASFVFVAGFGLFQFVTPALHLGHYLVVMWIKHGVIPRLNGFSYEPSYFATYLIMGWIMLVDLQATKAQITAGARWRWFTILVTLVFFLSTSKTAYLFLIVEGLARLAPRVWRVLVKQGSRVRQGSLVFPLPGVKLIFGIVLAMVFAMALVRGISRIVDPTMFIQGSGLGNTSSQSLGDRLRGARDTLSVIEEHPWIGLGFGGATGRVAELRGTRVVTMDDYRLNWPFPVPLDVVAASGLLGIIPFAWFFLAITVGERRLMLEHAGDERSKWLHALIRAMVYEWLILLVDQNLLRVYFWFHVTMVVVVGYNLRFVPSAKSAPEALATA